MRIIILLLTLVIISTYVSFSDWQRSQVEVSPIDTPYDSLDSTNATMNFAGIDCVDSVNCIAIANDANYYRVIYESSDAGKTWFFSYYNDYGKKKDYPIFRSLSYPSINKCVIGADSGVVYIFNEISSLKKIITPIKNHPIQHPNFTSLKNLQMLDTMFGIASTSFFIIYTKDGGYNWKFVDKPDSSCVILGSEILSPKKFIIYGACKNINESCPYSRTIFISNDTGNTWQSYNFENIDGEKDSAGGIIKLCFIDSLNGWAIGGVPTGVDDTDTKKIARTSDGGKSWILQYDSVAIPSFTLWDVSFHDENNGIAVGRFGSILLTTDGGLNWINDSVEIIQSTYPSMVYTSYRFISKPLIADFDGRIFYNDGVVAVQENHYKHIHFEVSPNPVCMTNSISINFFIENNVNLIFELINTLGIKIADIYSGFKEAGEHTIQFTPDVNLSSGTYWVRMIKDGREQMIKPIIILH